VHQFWGHWKAREAALVVDEIDYLVKTCFARKILFLDDHATVNARRMREISRKILQRGIETTLGCLGTVTRADRETLEMMRSAGFRWIHFGAEFASDEALAFMQKKITVAQIREGIKNAREAGLRVRTSWILDSPLATEDAFDRTIELILETQPQEVRAHFLSIRACAPFAQAQEASADLLASQQYIHAGEPHSSFRTLPRDVILEKTAQLTAELQKIGYIVVRNPADWAAFDLPENNHGGVRFISFCPGRYGIGWER
jgi:hypothetical protein